MILTVKETVQENKTMPKFVEHKSKFSKTLFDQYEYEIACADSLLTLAFLSGSVRALFVAHVINDDENEWLRECLFEAGQKLKDKGFVLVESKDSADPLKLNGNG
jgi:hypothetical protein